MTPTRSQLRWIRVWLYGPTIAVGAIFSIFIAFKNIGLSWFIAVCVIPFVCIIRMLENDYPPSLPSRRWCSYSAILLALINVWSLREFLFDRKPHYWALLLGASGIFSFILLPFFLFLGANVFSKILERKQ